MALDKLRVPGVMRTELATFCQFATDLAWVLTPELNEIVDRLIIYSGSNDYAQIDRALHILAWQDPSRQPDMSRRSADQLADKAEELRERLRTADAVENSWHEDHDTTPAYVASCPFCLSNDKVAMIAESRRAYAVFALDPPIKDSILIIPKRHIERFLLLPEVWQREEADIIRSLQSAGMMSGEQDYTPSWNLSYQTGRRIPHLHHWWIPRWDDTPSDAAFENGTATLIADARTRFATSVASRPA